MHERSEDILFLVACYTTVHPAMLFSRLVGWSPFYFFGVFEHTALAQMP